MFPYTIVARCLILLFALYNNAASMRSPAHWGIFDGVRGAI
jgi:hypothetical protein